MRKKQNSTRGFTMMETLIAVAIVVITLAIAFVAVINYQRSMKRLELDATAKEIFVAAQNHLTLAKSQGTLDARNSDAALGESHTQDGKTYRYFFVAPGDSRLASAGSVLYDMLPRFSLDDTVRTGGSYVIEYDPTTATITNVFYSDQSNLSEVVFTSGDYDDLFEAPGYVGSESENSDAAARRLEGFNKESNKIIGWYGGEDAKILKRAKLYAPRVEIINAECLQVRVSFTTTALNKMTTSADADAVLKLVLEGEDENRSQLITNVKLGDFMVGSETSSMTEGRTMRRYQTFILDDVTQEKQHFKQLWCKDGDANALIPGENVTVHASVETTAGSDSLGYVESYSNTENSLYGTPNAGAESHDEVYISNIRHLENLDGAISGYNPTVLGASSVIKAVQKADLSWVGDGTPTSNAFLDTIYANKVRKGSEKGPEDVKVFYLDGTSTKAGTYAPVNPTYMKRQDGNGSITAQVSYALQYNGHFEGVDHSITGVKVDVEDEGRNAGLFTELANDDSGNASSIVNLKLIDFDVKTASGNAGALAGTATGTTIENVVAYNTPASDDGAKEISGAGSVGGFVGSMSGGSITNSAAAVYVKSTGTGNAASAGGLIGATTAATTIEKSYAGGHTIDGRYLNDNEVGKPGRYNVQSGAAAGGLVGITAAETTINNSYSTCSAYGATVGGLVGVSNGKSITNSYATGLVGGAENAARGAFVGTHSGTTFSKDYYFDIINSDGTTTVTAASTGAVGGVEMADASVESLSSFHSSRYKSTDSETQKKQGAQPYDSVLKKYYNEMYPYKSTDELAAESYDGTTTHYGDWPAPETFVINVKQ